MGAEESKMMLSLFDLSGRTALVTGAGRGLGRIFALALAKAGADVAVADLDEDSAAKVAAEITAATGRRSMAIGFDVTDSGHVDALADKLIQAWQHVDILVNNAGINIRKPILDLTPEEFDAVYQVNLKGVFLCCRRFAREMKANAYGKIVNIASATAILIVPGMSMSPYYVTKAGVVQLTRAAAAEWAKEGIRVNAISPGWFVTDINKHLWENDEFRKQRLDHTPMGRVGVPEDLVGTLIYLCSSASDFVTGQNIPVDGGYTIW